MLQCTIRTKGCLSMTSRKTDTARAQENLEAVAEAQKKTIEAAVKNGTEAFAKGYERLYGASREQFEQANQAAFQVRSEERRVGKECGSTCRSRCSPDHQKKK